MRNMVRIGSIALALALLCSCAIGRPETETGVGAEETGASVTQYVTLPPFVTEGPSSATQTAAKTDKPSTATQQPVTKPNRPASATAAKTQAGTAPLPPATSTLVPVSVVIPEGFTFYQVAQRLEARGVCTAKTFYSAAQAYQVQSFSAPYSNQSCYRYEGFLFPDTYQFYKGDDPTAVLRKMLNNYAAKSGLPDYNTLILASIIERETRSASHMAMVSSVFHNRLRQGMKLQADATIAYVEKHIKADPLVNNPGQYAERYNTYKCAALPAGPICNPGINAIRAAKNPSQSDYLYYFFGNDNNNHYSKTHDEHVAAKAKYGVNYG